MLRNAYGEASLIGNELEFGWPVETSGQKLSSLKMFCRWRPFNLGLLLHR